MGFNSGFKGLKCVFLKSSHGRVQSQIAASYTQFSENMSNGSSVK